MQANANLMLFKMRTAAIHRPPMQGKRLIARETFTDVRLKVPTSARQASKRELVPAGSHS